MSNLQQMLKQTFAKYFRPDGSARRYVADDAVLDAEQTAAARSAAAEFVAHSREGHRLARRFPMASPDQLVDLVATAGPAMTKRGSLFAPENVETGEDALAEGASPVLDDGTDFEEFEEDKEDMTNKSMERLQEVAKSATGWQTIVKNVLDGSGACPSLAVWD